MRILILCAGDQTRWDNFQGVPKHLVELCGEPILHRTVRLLNDFVPDADIRVVVKNPKDSAYKITRRAGAKPFDGEAGKFLSSMHLWDTKEPTVILFGDVYWSPAALQTLVEANTDWHTILRFHPEGGEVFGFKLNPEHAPKVTEYCLEHLTDTTTKAGWGLVRYLTGNDPHTHQPINHPGITDTVKDLNDPWTDDFDYPQDWHNWCWQYAHAQVKPE